MAYYSALLSIIELLEDILHPLRFPNSFSDNDTPSFNSLHQKFTRLLDSLQDYSFIGHEADPLEARIRDESYAALDLIESQIPEHQHASYKILSMLIKKPQWCLQLERFHWKKKLEKVGQEVDSIVQELTAIKQAWMCEHVAAASEQPPPPPPQQIEPGNTMVGFDGQALAIKELLCGESSQLQVIPIVGMGGIGKTTLARHTFDDPLIVSKFDFRGWVTISQDYHVIRVLQDIAKSLSIAVEEHEREREIELKDHIYKYLKGRKFVIVIDDVWNTDVWDDIKHIFPNDANGSRIVLTTRLADVAEYVASIESLYHVQLLDVKKSWALLQEKALVKECCPSELVNIGRDIASKCGGLPLAIVVIGGILSNNKALRNWESVAKNVGSILSKGGKHLFNILSLSYNHLPHHLKPCLLHIASFPEDYVINISKLVRLWIAEGFLRTKSQSKNFEEIGKDYIKDLVRRSLVIIHEKKANGEIKYCVIHDLLRDFLKQRGRDEHFFHFTDQQGCMETSGMEKIRCIVVGSLCLSTWKKGNGQYAWAMCWFQKFADVLEFDGLRGNTRVYKLLRIFDIQDLVISKVPFAFSNMQHLKYLVLNLHYEQDHPIDPSIFKFQNLETLIIYGNHIDIALPSEIWKMSGLKYLIIGRMTLPPIPLDNPLQKLEFLHTLKTLRGFEFTNHFNQMISNVRNLKLIYECRDNNVDYVWIMYGLNNLVSFAQLEKLNITFHLSTFTRNDLLWRGFVLPQNLKKLCLGGCKLPWEAMRVVGCLKYLEVLKLRDNAFVGDVWETVEGEFLELKYLYLHYMYMRKWRVETSHFPKVQNLKMSGCDQLEEIPLEIGEIGTLQSIDVIGSTCVVDSAKKIQEEQQELGNYELQVKAWVSYRDAINSDDAGAINFDDFGVYYSEEPSEINNLYGLNPFFILRVTYNRRNNRYNTTKI